jgi:SAM-dependent methyltransferase
VEPYTREYYEKLQAGARRSAEEIVPLVLELVKPSSVIDVGCGWGTWLSVFRDLGVEDVLGVDRSQVNLERLEIPAERFLSFDLRKPFQLDRRFDLVLCLEVAEHLPAECVDAFVESLAGLGPVILFSAALPFQGGEQHVNEQWPDYWGRKFRRLGYLLIDCVREQVWDNDRVDWWYAQNALIFVREEQMDDHPQLGHQLGHVRRSQLSIVHPRNYLHAVWVNRVLRAALDVAPLIDPEETVILVDQDRFGDAFAIGSCVLPFLERDGCYWGPPADDETAIRELERLRRQGASHIVFGWPAFWWLDHYSEFVQYLRRRFACRLENERIVLFDLRSRGESYDAKANTATEGVRYRA